MLMRRRLPPLSAIRAFEAAARHLSFRMAAAEICVTPSAISHQVRALEEHLGQALFLRAGGRIVLTRAGQAYLEELTQLLDGLDTATRAVSTLSGGPFRVLSTPGFAARWLAPRLAACPLGARFEMRVSDGAPSTDFATNGVDVTIQWQADTVAGVVTEPLMQSVRYPVAAPAVAARIPHPETLLSETLLYAEVADGWPEWFRLAGVSPVHMPPGPRLAHCELSLTAAERGQGVTLAYDAMARTSLAEGRLVRLFDVTVPAMTLYSVAYPVSRARCPDIRRFRDWLFAEVTAEGTLDHQSRLDAAE
ncbi:MAG: LysR family transcriptional regulator [Paracoccaceae bacterium]